MNNTHQARMMIKLVSITLPSDEMLEGCQPELVKMIQEKRELLKNYEKLLNLVDEHEKLGKNIQKLDIEIRKDFHKSREKLMASTQPNDPFSKIFNDYSNN